MHTLAALSMGALDWGIIAAFFVVSLGIGLWASKSAGNSSKEFFLGGRSMPWWLLGVSMVATTFSTDTPNVVANFVRSHGVAKNWEWWAFLLSGMLTVFVFAKLWRRSEVMTDVEFYEVRFSGKSAAFLRGFRAIYLGLGFNVVIMGAVSLAAIKFGEIVLGVPGWQTLLVAGLVTLVYSSLGGLKGVIWTDFVQFILAMIGSVWAMFHILGHKAVGGIDTLLAHPAVEGKTSLFPDWGDPSVYVPIFLIPIAVQWWASYYPGAEPGGGGYIVQRMLSAKDEKNAIGATLFFNIAHYALRPWPWILIALASLVLVPMKIDFDYESRNHLKPEADSITRLEQGVEGADKYAALLTAAVAEREKNPGLTVTGDKKTFEVITEALAKGGDKIAYNFTLSSLENEIEDLEEKVAKEKSSDAITSIEKTIADRKRLLELCVTHADSVEIQGLAHITFSKFIGSEDKVLPALEGEEPKKIEFASGDLLSDTEIARASAQEQLVHMFLVNPVISIDKLGQDAGYPTMLKLLPTGLIGLVAASLIAAFMSTMSTQVNLGASYVVNDFYARFVNPKATEKQMVNGGRIATVVMLLLGSLVGLALNDANQAFKLILLIGAGTGLVYILRWFWWRVNAMSEIIAMVSSLVVSVTVTFILPRVAPQFMADTPSWMFLLGGTILTTSIWIIGTFLTSPTDEERLFSFYKKVQPGGPGWAKVVKSAKAAGEDLEADREGWDVPSGILCTIFGSIAVYTALFAAGAWIYSQPTMGAIYTASSVVSFALVFVFWKKLKMK